MLLLDGDGHGQRQGVEDVSVALTLFGKVISDAMIG